MSCMINPPKRMYYTCFYPLAIHEFSYYEEYFNLKIAGYTAI